MLTNISRTKNNQAMKFGQLINYNMRNIFLNKSWRKCAGETIPRPLVQQPRVLYNLFYCMPKLRLSQYIKTKLQTTLKLFWKIKRGLETSLPASFSAWFLKKNIPIVMFYYLTNFHCLLAFTSWDIGQYCIVLKPFFYK